MTRNMFAFKGFSNHLLKVIIRQSQLTIINNALQSLEETDTSLQQQVGTLDVELQEKGSQILTITEDITQVQTQNIELEDQLSTLKAQNEDFSGIIEEAIPAVVSIQTDIGLGSGFFIRKNGYIVTNYHVIENARSGFALTSDRGREAIRIVGFDRNADIAVLQAEGNFDYLRFANSDKVKVGETVIAVGNPGGLDFTVTQGIISSTSRMNKGNNYLQIDVPINPGNSGGPLINSEGEVVGVNTLKLSGFEGVGFALVSNQADDIVDEIIEQDQLTK